MDFYNGLALCLGIQALAMMVPGQNHFMLISISPSGRIALAMAVLGIASAGVVFSTGVILSIWLGGQAKGEVIFSTLNIIGSLYLIYLGTKLVWPFWKRIQSKSNKKTNNFSLKNKHKNKISLSFAFRNGFLINISNTKSVLFFVSIFSTTLPLHNMSMLYLGISVFSIFFNSIIFHGIVAAFFTLKNIQSIIMKWNAYIVVVAGLVFIIFGCFSASIAIINLAHK